MLRELTIYPTAEVTTLAAAVAQAAAHTKDEDKPVDLPLFIIVVTKSGRLYFHHRSDNSPSGMRILATAFDLAAKHDYLVLPHLSCLGYHIVQREEATP